jgi:hypothetical protein
MTNAATDKALREGKNVFLRVTSDGQIVFGPSASSGFMDIYESDFVAVIDAAGQYFISKDRRGFPNLKSPSSLEDIIMLAMKRMEEAHERRAGA